GRHDFHKTVIGRAEVVNFVDYGILHVPAKTDTGAYRSAIHASDILLDEATGTLSFQLLGDHPICGPMSQKVETTNFDRVWVANSFGHREERFEVKLKIKIGPKIFIARFTLADRSKKIYPILLGRKLLNHRFFVDSSLSNMN